VDGDDILVIYAAYSQKMTPDVVELFFTGRIQKAFAITMSPLSNTLDGFQSVPHGDTTFVIQRAVAPLNYRTLAHELGHVLTNQIHSGATTAEFYPIEDGPTPLFNDGQINLYRRLTAVTMNTARSTRKLGDLLAPGNSLLKQP
jgi:hypothetical protein